MSNLLLAVSIAKLTVLTAGPIAILAIWHLRASKPPSAVSYTLLSVVVVTACFWILFLIGEYLLQMEFHAIVPHAEWTPGEEAMWTLQERKVVDAYFGDGGRNVLALFTPILLLPYSITLWLALRALLAVGRRHA